MIVLCLLESTQHPLLAHLGEAQTFLLQKRRALSETCGVTRTAPRSVVDDALCLYTIPASRVSSRGMLIETLGNLDGTCGTQPGPKARQQGLGDAWEP